MPEDVLIDDHELVYGRMALKERRADASDEEREVIARVFLSNGFDRGEREYHISDRAEFNDENLIHGLNDEGQ